MSSYSGSRTVKMNGEPLPWVLFCFLFVIFYFATWYDPLYSIKEPATEQSIGKLIERGDLGRRIALITLGGWGAFNLLFKTKWNNTKLNFLAAVMVFYFVWSMASVSWSDAPLLTLRRVGVMAMLWLGAAWIAVRYSIRDVMHFVFFSGFTTIVFGVICEAYLGAFHPFEASYRFAGTFHPNTQGINCAILAIASYALSKTENRWKPVFTIMTIVAFMFIVLTKSRTSLAAAFVAIGVYWALTSSKIEKLAAIAGITIVSCVTLLLWQDNIGNLVSEATYFGRDASDLDTLSLRIPLWEDCVRYISYRPILGYGFDSFWTPGHVIDFSARQGWAVSHSHSGYIELALGAGIVGVIAFTSILLIAGARALWLVIRTADYEYAYCVSMIVWLGLQMVFEITNMLPFISTFVCIVVMFKTATYDSF